MKIESLHLELKGWIGKVSGQSTRREVESMFGEPDDVACVTKKSPRGELALYEGVEFHFDGGRPESRLVLVYEEQIVDHKVVTKLAIPFAN